MSLIIDFGPIFPLLRMWRKLPASSTLTLYTGVMLHCSLFWRGWWRPGDWGRLRCWAGPPRCCTPYTHQGETWRRLGWTQAATAHTPHTYLLLILNCRNIWLVGGDLNTQEHAWRNGDLLDWDKGSLQKQFIFKKCLEQASYSPNALKWPQNF